MSTLVYAKNAAITSLTFANRFTAGEAAINSYALKQFTAVGASATLANGVGTATDLLVVDDVTLLTVGNYYQIGSQDPVRINWTDPVSNTAGLAAVRTWADNAQVKAVTVSDGSSAVSGLTLNTSTGAIDGTPDTLGTTASGAFTAGTLLVRATFADSVSADSSPFDIQIDNPPVPPVFTGPISSESWLLGDTISQDYSIYWTGASSYSVTGTLPPSLTFNTATGVLSGVLVTPGTYANITFNGINSAGTTPGSTITLTVSLGQQGVGIGGGFDFSFGFGFFRFSGSPVSHLVTEGGDALITESGDVLVTEDS